MDPGLAGSPRGTSGRYAAAQVFASVWSRDRRRLFNVVRHLAHGARARFGRARKPSLASVSVEGWTASVLREDLNKLTQAGFERPLVRLLPYFNSYLLGHKERQHLVAIKHHPNVYRAQGWIAPVVLVDGRVVAVWSHTREGNRLQRQCYEVCIPLANDHCRHP